MSHEARGDVERQVFEQARTVALHRDGPHDGIVGAESQRWDECFVTACGRLVLRAAHGSASSQPHRHQRRVAQSRCVAWRGRLWPTGSRSPLLESWPPCRRPVADQARQAVPIEGRPGPNSSYRTAVLSPLKLKSSRSRLSRSGRGKRNLFGSPFSAARWIAGPPG